MTSLEVSTRTPRSASVVTAARRIDLRTEAYWRENIEDACAETTTKPLVVVDLTEVTFLSVGAAPLLTRAHYHCLHRSRRLRVVVPPGPVLDTLRITGVAELVALFRDLPTPCGQLSTLRGDAV